MPSDTSSDDLQRLLANPKARELIGKLATDKAEWIQETQSSGHRERLRELYAAYTEGSPDFRSGELVEWKPGLKNRTVPEYRQPAVVIGALDPPLLGTAESSGSAYFREPITHTLGLLDEEHELVIYHFDGNRFRRYELEPSEGRSA